MTREALELVVWAVVCAIVAAICVKRFVAPWLNSKEKTLSGRASDVLQFLQQDQASRATAYGSKHRTVWVSIVNVLALCALLLLTTHLALWTILYPLVGLGLLRLWHIPRDKRLRPNATWSERLSMRLYQAWSWPMLVVWAFRRAKR